jgi:hypothetical protein
MKRSTLYATAAAGLVLAAAGCTGTSVSRAASAPASAPPAATTTAPAGNVPLNASSAPATSGPVGTAFTVTTQDDSGGAVVYDVTLDQVVQHAQLTSYETLASPGDHMAAARFTVKGVTGQATDDANNDAVAIGSDSTEYPFSDNGVASGPNFASGTWSAGPGETVSGWVAFELPAGVTVASVQWSPGSFSGSHATWTV